MAQRFPPKARSETPSRSDTGSPVDPSQPTQNFEFVNFGTSTPALKDPDQRKRVRAHVVRDWSRRKKLHRLQSDKLKGRRIEPSTPLPETTASQPKEPFQEYLHIRQSTQRATEILRTSTPTSETSHPSLADEQSWDSFEEENPILDPVLEDLPELPYHEPPFSQVGSLLIRQPDSNSQMTPVLHHVRNMRVAMFPLSSMYKFNPVCPKGCVAWDANDEAVHHGILYATSTYANLMSGRNESREAIMHMGKTITAVNRRLKDINDADGVGVEEGIIGAVASIALAEGLRGNLEGWKIHMSGVKHLASLNDGLSKLSTHLRFKLYRADLMGAISFLRSPFFTDLDSPSYLFPTSYPTTSTHISPVNTMLHQILLSLPISPSLVMVLLSLSSLSTAITQLVSTPNQVAPSEQAQILDQTYSIQYSLLTPWSSKEYKDLDPMEEALRVAGLLYMHATWQDFPFAKIGPTRLIERLKELLPQVEISGEEGEGVLLWILFIGAISCTKGDSRIWFIANLQRLVDPLKLDRWEVVSSKVESLWWVVRIHRPLARAVWDEVVVLNGVLIGTDNI